MVYFGAFGAFLVFAFVLDEAKAGKPVAYANRSCDDYKTKDEFVQFCTKKYGGVVDGSRCFFVGGQAKWMDGWSVCREKGGEFAQIHTWSEAGTIWAYLWTVIQCCRVSGLDVWIPLYRYNNTGSGPYAIELNTTYWYQDVDTPTWQLKAANTFVRYVQPYLESLAPSCIYIGAGAWAALSCDAVNYVLCEYTGLKQNFTLTKNVCLAEVPVEEFQASKSSDCTKACARRNWCRSCNFVRSPGSIKCQLFPWSVKDACPTCPKTTNQTDCYHYNYVS